MTPDDAIAEVRGLYAKALAKANLTPESAISTFTFGLYGGVTDAQRAALANLQADKARIDEWATTFRSWAEAGVKATTGSVYTWEDWFAYGRDVLASDFAAQAQDAWDGSLFVADAQALQATGEQVASAASSAVQAVGSALIKPWVWWAAAGVALLVVVEPIVAPLLARSSAK